jgi:hypothetical protein
VEWGLLRGIIRFMPLQAQVRSKARAASLDRLWWFGQGGVKAVNILYGLGLVMSSLGCFAQWNPTYSIQISPPDPQPGEVLSVFIRATDPSGAVICPAARREIVGVTVSEDSVLLRLSNIGSGGGFPEPYCDGNTFRFGPLAPGRYEVKAATVLSNGTVNRAIATAEVEVAQVPEGRNFTALWGTVSESGWGLNVTHQGDVAFATLFV